MLIPGILTKIAINKFREADDEFRKQKIVKQERSSVLQDSIGLLIQDFVKEREHNRKYGQKNKNKAD